MNPAEETLSYPIEQLTEFSERVFRSFGVPEADARQAADVLAASDLRGIDSHGVARLHTYFDMLTLGRINPRPEVRVVRESPSTATVDGDNGLGLVVGPRANAIAMEKAEAVGSGWVSVRNTNHFGIAGYYPLQALKRDLIGWAMTNSTKLVAPLWAAERMLGTNPIAIAFPGLEEPPIVIDMATSAVAYGKIEIALRKGQPIPDGWAVDADRRAARRPARMIEGGALLPLGGDREHGGHKGYCLSAMVDILCGVLSGANWGPFAPPFAPAAGDPRAERRQGHRPFLRGAADRRVHRPGRVQAPDRRMGPRLPRAQARPGHARPAHPRRPRARGRGRPAKLGHPAGARRRRRPARHLAGRPASRSIEGARSAHRPPRPRDPGDPDRRASPSISSDGSGTASMLITPTPFEVEAAAGELRRERVVDQVAERVARPIGRVDRADDVRDTDLGHVVDVQIRGDARQLREVEARPVAGDVLAGQVVHGPSASSRPKGPTWVVVCVSETSGTR